jgi:citrate lyase subunit beta/citryl-CoA lyase
MAAGPVVTALYVPGDRPERFEKAVTAGPDVVILDLEDAVSAGRKEFARSAVAEYLRNPRPSGPAVQVRINGRQTPWWRGDLAALAGSAGLSGVRVPKVEAIEDLDAVAEQVPEAALHPMIESARGVQAMAAIAAARVTVGAAGVASIGLGEADLASDLGLADDAALDPIRSWLVVAARAAGLPPPMMSVWTALDDERGLVGSCRAGRRRGFLGRTAIHPRQLAAIREGFTPTAVEVEDARAVLATLADADRAGSGVAVTPDGRMVDGAMRTGAQRVVALADHLGIA